MRVIVHIGSTKTGSSALQATLYERRAELRAAEALYPDAGIAAGAHHVLAASIHPGAWRLHRGVLGEDPAGHRAHFDAAIAAIQEEIAARPPRTLILSSEYFWSFMPEPAYAALAEAFPSARFEVVAFVRRQDEWVASSYLQAVKSGEAREFSHWVKRFRSPESRLNYRGIIDGWAEGLRAELVHVIDYEHAKSNVYRSFCDRIGLQVATDVDIARVNPSPTPDSVSRLLDINRSDATPEVKKAQRDDVMRVQAGLTANPADFLTPEQRSALMEAGALWAPTHGSEDTDPKKTAKMPN